MSKATPFNGLRNTVAALMRLMDGKADKDKVVSSVNGQTGDVTVEVPAFPDNIVQSVNGAGPDENGNVQVQVGVTSWNDLQDRPFREEKVVIEWDGVATEKYPTFADGSPMTNFYKISNVASLPTDGTSVQIIATSNGGNEEIIVASVMKLSDTVCGLMINEEPLFFVAAVDGAQYSLMGTTIICPEAGTYAYRGLSGETIPQVTIEYTTVKQLDPKFIPDTIARVDEVVKSVNGIVPDENGDVQVEIPDGFSGSWNDLTDKPTQVSAFENDAGYLTEHQDLTDYASKTYVGDQIAAMVDSAPETLNTLNELATALGNDENFATTIATQLGEKANISDIPTKVSQLENDADYVNTDSEEIQTISKLANYQSNFILEDFDKASGNSDLYRTYSVANSNPITIYVDMKANTTLDFTIEVMTNTVTESYVGYKAFTNTLQADEITTVEMTYTPVDGALSVIMAFRNPTGATIEINKVTIAKEPFGDNVPKIMKTIENKVNNSIESTLGLIGIDYVTPQMYGAYADGSHDDTVAFQECINNSAGKIIYIPAANYYLKYSLTLDENVAHYIIRGGFSINGWYDTAHTAFIKCEQDFLTSQTGKTEKFYLEISNIRVRFEGQTNEEQIFLNNISLNQSIIKNCEILMPDIFLKGAFTYRSIMSECNILGVRKAVFYDGDYEIYDSSTLASSDGTISNCYINGAPSYNPITFNLTSFTRTTISDCYIDFFKSVLQGLDVENKFVMNYQDLVFSNCVIDYCWRVINASARYVARTPVSFSSCSFVRLSTNNLTSFFTNPDLDMVDEAGNWRKCGVVINDNKNVNGEHLYLAYIALHNNKFDYVDYPIYLGENISSCIEIYETGSSFSNCIAPVTIDVYASPEEIKTLHFDALMRKEYDEIPTVESFDNGYYRMKCFDGMIVRVNGELFEFTNMEWRKIVTIAPTEDVPTLDFIKAYINEAVYGFIDGNIEQIVNDKAEYVRDYAFYQHPSLTSVEVAHASKLGDYSFYKCPELKYVNAPEITSIGVFAFRQCSSLISAYYPTVTIVSNGAFDECTSLKDVHLPLLTTVEPLTFRKCDSLTSIDLPNVTTIKTQAFYSSGVTSLTLRSNTVCALENKDAFTFTPIEEGTGFIYVPSNLVDSYKAAAEWSTYANQIQAIV